MKAFKIVAPILAALAAMVAVVYAIKYRKTIRSTATNVTEKGKGKVMQATAWLKEVK